MRKRDELTDPSDPQIAVACAAEMEAGAVRSWLDEYILSPFRVLGWWFPTIMLISDLVALIIILAWLGYTHAG